MPYEWGANEPKTPKQKRCRICRSWFDRLRKNGMCDMCHKNDQELRGLITTEIGMATVERGAM